MNSNLFKLNLNDVARGAIVAVLAAAVACAAQQLNAPGFSLGAFDWQLVAQVSVTTLIGYLTKNFLSSDGKFLGAV